MTLDLYDLRRQHGGTVYDGGRRWVGPGPGHSRRDASLSVRISDDGRPLVHSFAGDPFVACAEHLGLELARPERLDRADWLRQRRAREEAEKARLAADVAFARAVWDGATSSLMGSPATAYLEGRGIDLAGGGAVRWSLEAPRSRQPDRPTHPAMVAAVQDAMGKLRGVHCTFLTPDGGKAFGDRSRLMFGPMAGCSVQLQEVGPEGVLAVAEGIETAASFADLSGFPTWAALSTSGLQGFVLPPGVRQLLIAADSDDGGAGLKAAHTLAERVRRSCDVEIHPAPEGFDWNSPEVRGG